MDSLSREIYPSCIYIAIYLTPSLPWNVEFNSLKWTINVLVAFQGFAYM